MDTLSITHIGPIIGALWVASWVGAIAFVGYLPKRPESQK